MHPISTNSIEWAFAGGYSVHTAIELASANMFPVYVAHFPIN